MPEQAKFTPGPWVLDLHPKRSFVRTEQHGAIADVWTSREGGKENATLIYAAPELYAACRLALSRAEADLEQDSQDGWEPESAEVAGDKLAIETFRAALAKADGVQSK